VQHQAVEHSSVFICKISLCSAHAQLIQQSSP
jgi:hypothetical protein